MAIAWHWKFDKLVKTVVATLLNKYDVFMIVEGGTGTGKSTFSLDIAFAVKRDFKKLMELDYETVSVYYELLKAELKGITEEDFVANLVMLRDKDAYNFKMTKHLIYSQKAMQCFLNDWHGIGIPDEMINVAFNRDFWSEDQKDIIKMINMFRDHQNFIVACVPQFNVLDNQIKNLCKIRMSIVRRGLAVIQTPNKVFYGKDKWDSAYNEKIEREWLTKKGKRPQYTKLTTFRGFVKFPRLSKRIEEQYQAIKDDKRSSIVRDEMGIEIKKEETTEEKLYKQLIGGSIKNMQIIEGVAMANGMTAPQLKARLRKMLQDNNKNPLLSNYFYSKKAKTEGDYDVQGIV
jgi:hypothetical protein